MNSNALTVINMHACTVTLAYFNIRTALDESYVAASYCIWRLGGVRSDWQPVAWPCLAILPVRTMQVLSEAVNSSVKNPTDANLI